jgi:DNA modification methylase
MDTGMTDTLPEPTVKPSSGGPSSKWPASNVEMWRVNELVPYARNSRTHTREQIAKIAASIREWGWTVPMLVDEGGGIIAGHARLLAAEKLGVDEVPVMIARGWSEAQKRAYVIADNRLAEDAGWDNDLLKIEMGDLKEEGFDLALTGFEVGEINDILDTDDLSGQDDVAPPKPDDPVSELGDIWILGRHRLVCGDCTTPSTVIACFNGYEPGLMVTDPPYGVNYDPDWRNQAGISKTARTGKVQNDDQADWTQAWRLFPGDVAYVWHGSVHVSEVLESLVRAGFVGRSQIIWKKSRFALSRGNYHWHHEPCFYATRPEDIPASGKDELIRKLQGVLLQGYDSDHDTAWYSVRNNSKARWSGNRRQSTIWEIPVTDDGESTHHGTQKPLECMARGIRNHDFGEVYDPFCGSGTTLIACEILERSCFAIELDPGYVDVIIARWQKRTGGEAVLSNNGKTFSEVAKVRSSGS